ncbi:MAG TPA: acyl-CoA synthetase FdrA [Ktedonobacteraceae bacterium]
MINLARVKRGMYFDSITLMKLARALSQMEGVAEASAVMATPANLQLLAEAGLSPMAGLTAEAGSNDVLLIVRASAETYGVAALESAEALLLDSTAEGTVHRAGEGASDYQPRSLEEARRMYEQASIAVISVPGMYAALEARVALQAGLHVFLFSDNVSLADEVALKRLGAQRELLVMGPDCGTALLNGVGLGFANVVPAGPIGIVGASGTGMQQVMCLLAEAGYGISQAIGCGGRDLSADVGGATTLQGLRLLQADEQTRVIVLVSKPPAAEVAELVLTAATSGNKPVVAAFIGADVSRWRELYTGKISFAHTLTEAARMASALCANATQTDSTLRAPLGPDKAEPGVALDARQHIQQPPYIAALFSGGTLCDEALHIWGEQIAPVYSNVPLKPQWMWHEAETQEGHYALDMGADEYTRGRPHPMIDPEARLSYLRAAASDPLVGVILLDIVLGYCAHPHPASIYAPLIQESLRTASQAGRRLNYVISLCGTARDPQGLTIQVTLLREAGAEIYTSNAEAAARCLALIHEARA